MKKILFPTDFSDTANSSFKYALRIAHQVDAKIHVLHTYKLPRLKGVNLPTTLQSFYEEIQLEEFQNLKDHIPFYKKIQEEQGYNDVTVEYSISQGDTVRTIIQTARKEESDLIVMGTEGASGLKEITSGTRAGEVLENASCPVLIIPKDIAKDSLSNIQNIAMTVSLAEEENQAINRVLDFANLFSAKVQCINMDLFSTSSKPEMEILSQKYYHVPNIDFRIIQGTDLQEALVNYLEENNIDILVMLTHQRGFIQELFQGSLTKKMAYHISTSPILVIQKHIL